MGSSSKPRQCPRCGRWNKAGERECGDCGTGLIRTPFRMTKERVRYVHTLALKRKGLSYEFYKMRLAAVGVDSCVQLKRASYARFVAGLKRLPDAPGIRRRT